MNRLPFEPMLTDVILISHIAVMKFDQRCFTILDAVNRAASHKHHMLRTMSIIGMLHIHLSSFLMTQPLAE